MKYKNIIIVSLTVWLYSCSNPNDKNLGNHYFLWEINPNHYNLIYSKDKDDADLGGQNLINTEISMANFNDYFIVAKSIDGSYWVVDKRKTINLQDQEWEKKVLIGPLDTLGYVKYLKNNNISIKLRLISN